MRDNVQIYHRKNGKLVEAKSAHNIMTQYGREWLTKMVSCTSFFPQTPEADERLKYFGLGIGSTRGGPTGDSTIDTAYPAGNDPNATSGDEYDPEYPTDPDITTLELPVRKSGGSNPYPSAAGTDVWLFGPPEFYNTHQTLYSVSCHIIVDATSGDVIYSPFTTMPLSEAGLFTDVADVNDAYDTSLVAYVSFDTITIDATSELEFIWSLRF